MDVETVTVALVKFLLAEGKTESEAVKVAKGLYRVHLLRHATTLARKGCPYCLSSPTPGLKWT
jgi:hypothetical protein